jgi:CCR4-NOT transcription complex subunit 9
LVLWGGFGESRSFRIPLCWQTGVMASLILEIVSVYPSLSPASLSAHASNRVCNALALLQCVASHNETRSLFLNGEFALLYFSQRRS